MFVVVGVDGDGVGIIGVLVAVHTVREIGYLHRFCCCNCCTLTLCVLLTVVDYMLFALLLTIAVFFLIVLVFWL